MALGTLALAWLLAAPLAADVCPMSIREFRIPITLNPEGRSQIKTLLLYSSPDQGKTWNLEKEAEPTTEAFPFLAKADGLYWFMICTIDQQGRRDPESPYQGKVNLKVLIDTVRPEIKLTAERQGDGVAVSWEIAEENPNLATLKLEYRMAEPAGGQWTLVPLPDPALRGNGVIRPVGSGALSVRVQMQDVAGNHTAAQAEVQPAPPTPGGGAPVTPLIAPPPSPGGGSAGSPTTGGPVSPDRGDGWAPISGSTQPVVAHSIAPAQVRQIDVAPAPSGGVGMAQPPAQGGAPEGGYVLAQTRTASSPSHGEPLPGGVRPVRGPLPPLQVVNSNRVTLDYEGARFGASGVGSVELYVTRNEGQTWERWAGEQPPPQPPADPRAGPASMRRSLTAELPGEGTFGFWLVVKSGVGRGKPPPQNGDVPQVRVEVDLTPPEAKLFPLEPVQGRRDALAIRWVATDRNLGPTPVLIEWCDRKDGQWQAIGGAELPNTGQYIWQVPTNVPPQVYLRLSVRDTAGNVGVAETSDKVTIDLNEPEVKVIGLSGSR